MRLLGKCIWKCKGRDFYPKCFERDRKGNIYANWEKKGFISYFKYCPYCGRKIVIWEQK